MTPTTMPTLTPLEQMLAVPNLLPALSLPVQNRWRKALQIFKNDAGKTHGDIFTPTQLQVVDIIAKRRYPRTQLILPTQYGKSYAVADGVALRVSTHKEKWAIVAPTEDKARIIMDYIIDLIFEHPILSSKLEYNGSKESLKKERSKTRITFRGAGEVRVYSGNASNTKATKSALMGFGAPNIILDEAGQIGDELYSTVKRMVGGSEGTESGTFLLEIGNPVFRNHFHRTWFGNLYKKIYLNAEMALKEGRYTQAYLDEMKNELGYEWMYECIFPASNDILPNGYRRLVSDIMVDKAMVDMLPDIVDGDQPVMGVDVAGGGKNQTKLVVRYPKSGWAMVAATSNSSDLEEIADLVETEADRHGIGDYRIAIDAGGVGHGLPAILMARNRLVKPILFGESSGDKAMTNMRAYMYWQARKWLNVEGGKLMRDDGFLELKLINYRQNSSLKLQIEPKEEMIKRLSNEGIKVESPDTADAFVLTFVDTSSIVEADDIYVGDDLDDYDDDIYAD